MSNRPYTRNLPIGTGPDADFMIQVMRTVFESMQIFDSTDIGVTSTPRGQRLYLKNKVNQTQSSGGGMQFLGEYSATLDAGGGYSTQDVVVVSAGANLGTYVYVNASPSSGAAAPWVGGGYWTQLPGGLFSQWL